MLVTCGGILLLAVAPDYHTIILAGALMGIGSSVFHPESSRVARYASGGHYGLAQSVFQLGGNVGSALGPLTVAVFILPLGRSGVAWFCATALLAAVLLRRTGKWFHAHLRTRVFSRVDERAHPPLGATRKLSKIMIVLAVLVFSKYIYLAGMSSYYTLFLIARFHVSIRSSQLHLFIFLAAVALGTCIGGPLGDRVGRKTVIWLSILGALPFAVLLPYVSLGWATALSIVVGVVIASAFSAILVYAQESMPRHVGTVSGVFFGLSFGLGGIGAALIGRLADAHGLVTVFRVLCWLPALGVCAFLLPAHAHAAE